MQVADLFIRFVGDDAQVRKQLEGLDKPAGAAGTKAGTMFSTATKRAMTGLGAAGGAVFTTALEGATAFEDQLRVINTVAKLPDQQLSQLGSDILKVSGETGKSTDDLTQGFYDLVSAGVPAGEAIGVLRDSAKFATGALGTTGEAVDLVTSAMNAYGLQASDSGRITDIFAKAVADGKVTAAELGASIANIAPIAASAGVSLEEVSAGYALLTAKGVPAAQASTQMRAAISALLTPNKQLNDLQKQTGINFAELAREKGLAVALEEVRKATNGNNDAFAKSLGSIEAYQFALATTGENAGAMAGQIEETASATGLAQEQYDEASKSAANAGNRMAASVKAMLIEFGGPFVQTMGPALQMVNQLGPALGGAFSSAKLLGTGIGALGGKVLGMLTTTLLPAVISAGTTAGGALAAAIPTGMALLPVLLIAALVAAIAFLIANPEVAGEILRVGGEIVSGIINGAASLVGALLDLAGRAISAAGGAISTGVSAIVGFLLSIPGRVASWVGSLLGQAGSVASGVGSRISSLAGQVVGFVLSIPGRIVSWVASILGQAGQVASGVGSRIIALAASVVSTVLSIPGRIVSWVASILGQAARAAAGFIASIVSLAGRVVSTILGMPGRFAGWVGNILGQVARAAAGFIGKIVGMAGEVVGTIIALPGRIASTLINGFASVAQQAAAALLGPIKGAVDGAMSAIGGVADFAGDVAGNVGGFLGGLVPKFDLGTVEVPHDMVAMIHAGEMIIPAREAEAIRQGRAGLAAAPPMPTQGGPGGQGGTPPPLTVHVYNPEPEPASTSVRRELQKAMVFGGLS